MKKTLFLIISLSISTFCFSKKTLSLKWKAGDSINITMTLHSNIINENYNSVDSVLTTKSILKIEEANKKSYKIKLNTYNQLINFGQLYCPDLLKKTSMHENLSSYFIFYSDSMSYEILNRSEYDKALKSSYDSILHILNSSNIESFDKIKIGLTELYNSLNEKSEAMHILDILIETYETIYSKNDTIFSTDSIVSPLNRNRYLTTNEKTYVDKKNKKTFEILVDKKCVFEMQKDLLPDFKKQIERKFKMIYVNADTTEINNQMQTIINSLVNSYEFEGSELYKITKDKKSNWPTRISKEARYVINNSGVESKILVNILLKIE